MGLDSVEILIKVEDTFAIKIPNQQAEKIITVGDFHNVVWQHLEGKPSDKCKSQNLFYKLRKSFSEKFNFPLNLLHLDTSPEQIFPKTNRRQEYLNFGSQTNLKLPDLTLTKPWTSLLSIFGFVTVVGGLAISLILINFFNHTKWIISIPIGGIILTLLFSELLNSKRTLIQDQTMRDFTYHTLALNYSELLANEGTNRQEMETVINHIIADKVGLNFDEVTFDKKIADDLGVD